MRHIKIAPSNVIEIAQTRLEGIMFNWQIKFDTYPTFVKAAIVSLSLGWLVHLVFYYKFFTGDILVRNDYLMFIVGVSICFFVASINKWARPLCLFFNIGIMLIYLILLYVYFQKPEYDKRVLSIAILFLFGISTYLLLRRDTIAYFRDFNEDAEAGMTKDG